MSEDKFMNILLVEDDYRQAEQIIDLLKKNFSNIHLLPVIYTEYEFRQYIQENIGKSLPDIVLLDVMLPWTDADDEMPRVPDDVDKGGFYRAGIRCKDILRQTKATKTTPVILYSVLEMDDLKDELEKNDENTVYLSKSSESTLVDKLKQLLNITY